ncbi:MAG: hypothetical protein J0I12_27935 [Candidatus Eremiobacteraeota bacterium]|nr:hypothetical protein [Candidatus Eremiobacteraeota bacterium]
MSTTTQTLTFDPKAPIKAHPFAPPHIAPVVPGSLTGCPEVDDDLDQMRVAHFLLSEHSSGEPYDDLSGCSPAVRRYLSGINLADNLWMRSPLLFDLAEVERGWGPHHFNPRTRDARKPLRTLNESVEARRELAFDYVCEATEELREFLTACDWENNRLVKAVATAIRGEVRRLVDFIDAGCPRDYGDDAMAELISSDTKKIAYTTEKLRGVTGRPSAIVEEMVLVMKFEVEEAPLGLDCPFVIDTRKRVVTLAAGMKADERAFQLARVLAMVRLCLYSLDKVDDAAQNQRDQDLYAQTLLLPEVQVRDYIAAQPDLSEKALVAGLAEAFGVPKRVVRARLDAMHFETPLKVNAA